ncbi:MAG: hypothetical protein MJ193_03555, partial [Clostridia bacterium]|nr:hypothetical protein [Clostridia bacterium]
MSKVGKAISSFTIGFFGLADYAYSVVGVIIGIAIVFNLKVKLPISKILLYFGLLALGIYALQVYTSSAHIIDANYGEYLVNCYKGTNTAGGMLFGLAAYPLMKAITTVGALVIICVAFFIIALIALIPTIKKNVTYTAEDKATKQDRRRANKAGKVDEVPETVETPQNVAGTYSAPSSGELYVAPMAGDNLSANRNGAGAYNPLYPNSNVNVEDTPVRYPSTAFTPHDIAIDILFGDNVDKQTLDKFNTANNPQYAFSNIPNQPDRARTRELRNILGMNGAENTVNTYYVPRSEEKPVEKVSENVVDDETPELPTETETNNTLGYSSFEELKKAQIKQFSARMSEPKQEEVTPTLNTVAYGTPTTENPVRAEIEKPIVATPKTVIAKPEVKTTPNTPASASNMSGFIGTVERAITGEEIAQPVQIVKPQETASVVAEEKSAFEVAQPAQQPINQPISQPVAQNPTIIKQVETRQEAPTIIEKTVYVEKPVSIIEK